MFDSAVIGLKYLYPQCSRILFSPVDVPLFTADTIKELLITPGDIIVPTYEGQPGHPVLISGTMAQKVCHMKAPAVFVKPCSNADIYRMSKSPIKGFSMIWIRRGFRGAAGIPQPSDFTPGCRH